MESVVLSVQISRVAVEMVDERDSLKYEMSKVCYYILILFSPVCYPSPTALHTAFPSLSHHTPSHNNTQLLDSSVFTMYLLFSIFISVSYTHLRAHETPEHLVCRLLLEKKKKKKKIETNK
eukprot:TRINITY_DN15037_c0_g1_i4.p1 TRINITY_DN15037_c0_g1~~TRINITY_DN15037_c0_g1_i4.p1  ORF type:complete len:121 (+),score=20.54 TRINITY_DN15037_c0_g1_i4:217-579(+)